MTYFTNMIKYFKPYIDKLTKRLYNSYVLRLLCKDRKARFAATVAALIAVSLSFSSDCFATGSGADAELRLSVSREDKGLLYVFVDISEGSELCGLFAELVFDGCLFELISGELVSPNDGRLGFFMQRGDGRVGFVADAEDNELAGRIARFVFAFKDDNGSNDAAFFAIYPREAYCRQGNSFRSLSVSGGDLVFSSPNEKLSPSIERAETLLLDCGSAALRVSVKKPIDCFAAGVEVTVLELDGMKCERYSLIGVRSCSSGGDNLFICCLPFPKRGTVCVAVRPLSYDRAGAKYGDGEVFVLIDGRIRIDDMILTDKP